MSTVTNGVQGSSKGDSTSLSLELEVVDRVVIDYLLGFDDEHVRREKALEALKVGVIAIQSASPTLDMRVVQERFTELDGRMKDFVDEFTTRLSDDLQTYFKSGDGQVPKQLEKVFGDEGLLSRHLHTAFDPATGRVRRLLDAQHGPGSEFATALDPNSKEGILARIEKKVHELVSERVEAILSQFSLDDESSAMSRLHCTITRRFDEIKKSLDERTGKAGEREKGARKGVEFEECLYHTFSELGKQLGDSTELVRGVKGPSGSKKGDFVAELGESSGAPGTRVVVEVKNSTMRFKDAQAELKDAKTNREAAVGIMVFAKGNEPTEVGDFHRIGEDFYCTVDKQDLEAGCELLYLEAAYRIARELVVVAARKEAESEVDLHLIESHVSQLLACCDRVSEIITKAKTVKSSGDAIEKLAAALKEEMDSRLKEVLANLRKRATSS